MLLSVSMRVGGYQTPALLLPEEGEPGHAGHVESGEQGNEERHPTRVVADVDAVDRGEIVGERGADDGLLRVVACEPKDAGDRQPRDRDEADHHRPTRPR